MLMDVHQRGNLRFPQSLPEFQRLFPDDAACAGYLEKARWSDGFVCPHCQAAGEPFRFANRPGVLRCRKCRRDTGLTVGTVMARSHTPLSVWFWSAYLVSSQTPGMSAVQLRRQLGLSRGSTLHVVGVGNNRIGKDLWTKVCGKNRWLGTTEALEHDIRGISDTRLWQFRTAASTALVEYARERLSSNWPSQVHRPRRLRLRSMYLMPTR